MDSESDCSSCSIGFSIDGDAEDLILVDGDYKDYILEDGNGIEEQETISNDNEKSDQVCKDEVGEHSWDEEQHLHCSSVSDEDKKPDEVRETSECN